MGSVRGAIYFSLTLLAVAGCDRPKQAPLSLNWTLVARATMKASIGWPAGVTDVWFIETPGTITLTFPDQTAVSMPFQDISVMSSGPRVRQIIINLANATPEQAYPVALQIAGSLGITDTMGLAKWYDARNRSTGSLSTSASTVGNMMPDKTARTVSFRRSFSGTKQSVFIQVVVNVDAGDYEAHRKADIKNRRANGEDVPDDFGL